MNKVRKYAKFIAAIGAAAVEAAAHLALPVPDAALGWVQLGIAVAGAVAVYGIPNGDDTDPETDPDYDAEAI